MLPRIPSPDKRPPQTISVDDLARLVERAKERFGITDDPYCAGYILPDGSLLRLRPSRGSRARYSHCKISEIQLGGQTPFTEEDFKCAGLIRLDLEIPIFEIQKMPSAPQVAQLRLCLYLCEGKSPSVDAGRNWGRRYEPCSIPSKTLGDIIDVFKGKAVPNGDGSQVRREQAYADRVGEWETSPEKYIAALIEIEEGRGRRPAVTKADRL